MSRFDPLDPFDLDAEDRQQKEQEERERLQKQAQDDFRWVMSTPQGRRYIWRMLERTGIYRTTFRPNSEMAFLEGVRSVGVTVLTDCHTLAFDETLKMMNEARTT